MFALTSSRIIIYAYSRYMSRMVFFFFSISKIRVKYLKLV